MGKLWYHCLARSIATINKIIERVDTRQFSRMGKADAERIYHEWMHLEETPMPISRREDTGAAVARSQPREGGIGSERNGESSLDALRRQRKPSVLPRFSKILEFISGSLSSGTAGKWSKFHPARQDSGLFGCWLSFSGVKSLAPNAALDNALFA